MPLAFATPLLLGLLLPATGGIAQTPAAPDAQTAAIIAAMNKIAAPAVNDEIVKLAPILAKSITADPSNLASIPAMAAAVNAAASANFKQGSANYNALVAQILTCLQPQIVQSQDLVPNGQAAKDLGSSLSLAPTVGNDASAEAAVEGKIKGNPKIALRNWESISKVINTTLKSGDFKIPLGGTEAQSIRKQVKADIFVPSAPATPATAAAIGSPSGNSNISMLNSAQVQVGSDLKLVTGGIFSGRVYALGGTNNINLSITTSLPATVPNLQSNSEYSDAEIETPDGALLNMRIGLLSSLLQNRGIGGRFLPADYFLPNSGVPIYGDRSQAYDRYYFEGGDTTDGNPASELEISTGEVLVYLRDGIDLKLINRGVNSTVGGSGSATVTPSSALGDYGGSAGYYLAFGMDGGLYGQGQTIFSTDAPTGSFRLEGLLNYEYTDKESLFNYAVTPATSSAPASTSYGGLYPNFYQLYPKLKYPGPDSLSLGGRLSIHITNSLSFDVTAMWPVGGSRGYMGKTLLGGFSISNPATSATTSTGANTGN